MNSNGIELPEDLNKIKAKEINKIARMIAKTNTAYWDAIGMAGSLNSILNQFDAYEQEEVFKKIAKAFENLKSKNDDGLIDPELYRSETQQTAYYFSKFREFTEE